MVSHYLQRGSSVFTCFLDASKVFNLVRHSLLFKKLLSVGLPDLVVRLLSIWYSNQQLNVRWGKAYSNKFDVSNSVRQGGVLSPILFSIYLDTLLISLKNTGVGCFWSGQFAGAVAYTDDIVLMVLEITLVR